MLDSNTHFTGQSKYYPILLDSNTSKNEYLLKLGQIFNFKVKTRYSVLVDKFIFPIDRYVIEKGSESYNLYIYVYSTFEIRTVPYFLFNSN